MWREREREEEENSWGQRIWQEGPTASISSTSRLELHVGQTGCQYHYMTFLKWFENFRVLIRQFQSSGGVVVIVPKLRGLCTFFSLNSVLYIQTNC